MSAASRFPKLFEAGRIGKLRLKNRIVMPPMGTRYCSVDGFVSERSIDYYSERARGGVGLLIVEAAVILPDTLWMLHIEDDKYIPYLRKLAEAIHKEGIPVVLQLALPRGIKDKANPLGPSEVPVPGTDKKARALTVADIKGIMEQYGKATRRAMNAGFDGIMIHGGHGYLISNFLSPLTNKRTDEYGGDLKGRARLALELAQAARRNTSADYPIIFRLMADEKVEGGFGLHDAIVVCKMLQEASVDAIDVVAGGVINDEWITPPMTMPPATNAPLSEAIKKEIKIPVMVAGKINDPYIAESILADGKADFVDIGRALITDPLFPRKAMEGKIEDIRKCIGCLKCREAIAVPSPMVCTVNPAAGREKDFDLKIVRKAKRILVVGGGPAGITASLLASQKGHGVTLWEEGEKLGGQLNLASVPPGKGVLAEFLEYLRTQLKKSGVKVELQRKATDSSVLGTSPDAVIIATGSKAIIPQIKGINKKKIVSGRDVLAGCVEVGQRVIIIGGGYIGCEIAEFLADRGKDVTIVEILEELAHGVFARVRKLYLEKLSEKRVKTFTGVKGEEITESGIYIINSDGKRIFLDADTIIVATGSSPDKALSERLSGKVPLYTAGDCVEARSILEAIREGAEAAIKV